MQPKGVGTRRELRGLHHRGPTRGAARVWHGARSASAFCGLGHSAGWLPKVSRGLRRAWRSRLRCFCAPWRLLGDTFSPALELVAAGPRCGGRGRRGGGGRPHREGRPESSVRGGRDWLQRCGDRGGGGDHDCDPREGGRGLGTGPKAAGPAEGVAVPEKDELVSGSPGRRFSLLPL